MVETVTKEEWLARVNKPRRTTHRPLTDVQIREIRASQKTIPVLLRQYNINRDILKQIRDYDLYSDVF